MYIDICGLFGLSQTSFFHPIHGPLWPTLYAIDLALVDYIQFQTDVTSCEKAASAFALFSRGMLNNCVCAVDGNNCIVKYFSYFALTVTPILVVPYIDLMSNLLSMNPIHPFIRSSHTHKVPKSTRNAGLCRPGLIVLY
jgi:hypothetical protein